MKNEKPYRRGNPGIWLLVFVRFRHVGAGEQPSASAAKDRVQAEKNGGPLYKPPKLVHQRKESWEGIQKGILTPEVPEAGCLFCCPGQSGKLMLLFRQTYLWRHFQESRFSFPRTIVPGSAEEAEGVRHQETAFYFFRFQPHQTGIGQDHQVFSFAMASRSFSACLFSRPSSRQIRMSKTTKARQTMAGLKEMPKSREAMGMRIAA